MQWPGGSLERDEPAQPSVQLGVGGRVELALHVAVQAHREDAVHIAGPGPVADAVQQVDGGAPAQVDRHLERWTATSRRRLSAAP